MPSFVKPEDRMDNSAAAQAFAAIGSASRIQVLVIIIEAGKFGLTIGEIQKKTNIAASTLAHHLRFLSDVNLIIQEKQGRKVVNRTDKRMIGALSTFLKNILEINKEGNDVL